jgi:tripartite-type tricarboxylate transporter receptor subunit TctC
VKTSTSFLYLSAAACLVAAQLTAAQSFPTRPMRFIVPFSAGSASDLLARMIGPKLTESWGQQVIVESRPSAGGTIAGGIVAASNPDGHTLMLTSSAFAGSAALYEKLPYDSLKDFSGVTQVASTAIVLVISPSVGARSVKELIALAKQKPGVLTYGSAGIGSGTHYANELFALAAGINVVHVPYKGIPEATNDLMAGRVQLFMAPLASSTQLIRDGRMRALGITSPRRNAVFPDIPTVAEAAGLPGFRWDSWGAIFAPAKTQRAIIGKLNLAITDALRQSDVEKIMRSLGAEPSPTTPAELDQFVLRELATIEKIARLAGIQPE